MNFVFLFQNTQMTADDIENAYNELVSSIERESRRLRQTLAEQQMKDEEERLKKIQVIERVLFEKRTFERIYIYTFRTNLKTKKRRNPMKIDKSNKKKKNFDSRIPDQQHSTNFSSCLDDPHSPNDNVKKNN